MRTNDIIGRIGGEEFAAIVPGGMDVAIKIGERVRSGFEIAGATVGLHAIGATVSIGAASASAPIMEVGPLLVRADAALYRAKHDGRNRLHAAEDEAAGDGPGSATGSPSAVAAKKEQAPRRQSADKRPASAVAPVGA
jgi:predicted signal transduction protein with EAL and GGDEF domain